MSGKALLVYPGHKFKYGFMEDDLLTGDVTEIVYDKEADMVFKITGFYHKGEK